MHRKITNWMIGLLLGGAISPTVQAQDERAVVAAVHDTLRNAANDTVRMMMMAKLQGFYSIRNIDSTLYYLDQVILTARKIKQPLWAGNYSLIMAYYLQKKYNFSKSFRLCNEALAIAQDPGNEKNYYSPWWGAGNAVDPKFVRNKLYISAIHQLGNTYAAAGNREKAIDYYRREIELAYEFRDSLYLVNSNRYIGAIYSELNRLDSALLYSEKALAWAKSKRGASVGPILNNIGMIFLKRGMPDSAERYLRESIFANGERRNREELIGSYTSMAALFEMLRQPDSVLHYAGLAYTLAKEINAAAAIRTASEKISEAWLKRGNPDSAIVYLSLSKNIGDSLDREKTENLIQFQNTGFEEQLKLEKQAQENIRNKNKIRTIGFSAGLILLSLLALVIYRNNRQKHKANTILQKTLSDLKETQTQLVHAEKMASLGELTAGIAHEIQNPLNFVNNFSELNAELLDEMQQDLAAGNWESARELAGMIRDNQEKINHHGKRADGIVKGMLQHSRSSSGQKEPTDINALCDEYLRLAYHGLRAKDKSFNAKFEMQLDPNVGMVSVLPQEMGRVILNLINNAFYAVNERKKTADPAYEPCVTVSTRKTAGKVEIEVRDNGTGIPQKAIDKIFQPFFTTKPTGEGTGLGLSLSYDIVTKGHGGELNVNTVPGEGTAFIIRL